MAEQEYQKRHEEAQAITTYRISHTDMPRIKWGDDYSADEDERNVCHDCAVQVGEYHLPGCDAEECPNCGGQAFACDCDYQEQPGLDPYDWRIY